jgi:hypothetical protein
MVAMTTGATTMSPTRTSDFTATCRKRTRSLYIFYSLNRFIDHEACISAGSVEICRALFVLDVVGARSSEQ